MEWTSDLAYAVGLIATDGNLSKDGRHIDLTSKDIEQIYNFTSILNIKGKIGFKSNGTSNKKYFRVQFSDVKLYSFLLSIGLTPVKSKTIGAVKIPDKYFMDFLRGCLDGDGYTHSYWDPRWKSSFMLYTGFISASKKYLYWLRNKIESHCGVAGKIKPIRDAFNLIYAKNASIKILKLIYYDDGLICLTRKKFKINVALDIIRQEAAGVL